VTGRRVMKPRLPAQPPAEADIVERDSFQKLVTESLPAVRTSAETWRNGLAAFITLVTTAAILKGRSATSDLPTAWRIAVTALIAAGMLLAVVGLWQALAAQAGARPEALTLTDIQTRYGSVRAFQVATAVRAARRLGFARYAVAVALALLFCGIGLTWWAPAAPPASKNYLKIDDTHGSTCGTLESADGGKIRLTVAGRHDPVVIDLSAVRNIFVVDACPAGA
jgi:hypothetical protein